MHFALPPRKTSQPPPYVRASARNNAILRRQKAFQLLGTVVLGSLFVYMIFRWFASTAVVSHHDGKVPQEASIMIVTVLDNETMSEDYIRIVKANREDYAARHGYQTWYTTTADYAHLTSPSPSSWSLIPALRQAMALHPKIDYVWSLTPHALITNITLDLHSHILDRLPTLMRKDIPVVPPDSVIHTFTHLSPAQTQLIMAQDMENLAHTSFLLRNSASIPVASGQPHEGWSSFFLDAWFDPLYRTYAFQKAENHALEHIVQWHPTILAKLVIIEQRLFNSYNFQSPILIDPDTKEERDPDTMWQPGDFVINLKGCVESRERDCEQELREYYVKWQTEVERVDGTRPDVQLQTTSYVAVPKQAETGKAGADSGRKGRQPMQDNRDKPVA